MELKLDLSGDVKKVMREKLRGYLEERLGNNSDLVEADALLGEQSSVVGGTSGGNMLAVVNKSPQEILADKRRSGILATHGTYIALIDEKRGMIYYHDEATNRTSWNRPDDFPFIKLSAAKRKELQEQNRRYLEWRKEGTVKKVNVLGKGVVTASSSEESIGNELNSLNQIQLDIDARLSQVKVAIYKDGEWAAYLDEKSDLVYYYNEVEKKSVWDAPSEEFLEKVKERMMDDFNSFVGDGLDKDQDDKDDVLDGLELREGDDVTREVKRDKNGKIIDDKTKEEDEIVNGLELREGDDVTREVKRDENGKIINDRTEMAQEPDVVEEEDTILARSPIDYDAAVRLAYDATWFAGDFDKFKAKYLLDTSNMVASKHKKRMEEAAKIAAELRAAQQQQLEEEARLARSAIDYDAAARLSYESAGSVGDFDAYRSKYVVDTSAMVAEKFKSRMEALTPVEEPTVEVKETAQGSDDESKPFFLLDAEVTVAEPVEQPALQRESSEVVIDEVQINVDSDVTVETPSSEVLEEEFEVQQPQLPTDDPFASGSNVASLISPLKSETLYDILQVDISATRSEIKRSYITLAKETHPDALLQNGIIDDKEAEKKFNEIARAYKILSDPTERRRYNRELKAKGLSRSAGNMFENWVMGAAKAMDEALTKAEQDLEYKKDSDSP